MFNFFSSRLIKTSIHTQIINKMKKNKKKEQKIYKIKFSYFNRLTIKEE